MRTRPAGGADCITVDQKFSWTRSFAGAKDNRKICRIIFLADARASCVAIARALITKPAIVLAG